MADQERPGFLALTDADWALYLRNEHIKDNVNFWSPKPKPLKKRLAGSTLVMLSKAASPWPRRIIGYGQVRDYQEMTPEEAWSRFARGNGAATLHDLRRRLGRLASGDAAATIGCTILDDLHWLDEPISPENVGLSIPTQVVRGKTIPAEAVTRIRQRNAGGLQGTPREAVRAIDQAIRKRQLDSLCWFDDHLDHIFHGPLSQRGSPTIVVPPEAAELDGEADGWWGGVLAETVLTTNGPSLADLAASGAPVGVVESISEPGVPAYRSLGVAFLERISEGTIRVRGLPPGTLDLLREDDEAVATSGPSLAARLASILTGSDRRRRVQSFVTRRSGQQGFRKQLLELYEGQCALTRAGVEQALEAAHVLAYRGPHTNAPENGILMRADVHRLFDKGLFYIDPEHVRPVLSKELRQTEYADLLTSCWLPPTSRPPKRLLEKQMVEAKGKANYE